MHIIMMGIVINSDIALFDLYKYYVETKILFVVFPHGFQSESENVLLYVRCSNVPI